MKKIILSSALLLSLISFRLQAQSTASGSSNTGNGTSGSTPAQNGSTGPTVSSGSASKFTNSKSSGSAMPGSSKGTTGSSREVKKGKTSRTAPASSTSN